MNVLNRDLVGVLLPGNQGSHAQSDLPWRGLPPATPPPAEPALVAHHESLLRPATIPRARVAEPRRKAGSYQTYFSHHPPFRVVRSTPRRRAPLTDLGLTLTPGQKLRADLGLIFGPDTNLRFHWSNQSTGHGDDLPGEIMLTPAPWGEVNLR